jgi:hypothetical protein
MSISVRSNSAPTRRRATFSSNERNVVRTGSFSPPIGSAGEGHGVVEAADVLVEQGVELVAGRVQVADLVALDGVEVTLRHVVVEGPADVVVGLDHAGAVAAHARHAVADQEVASGSRPGRC